MSTATPTLDRGGPRPVPSSFDEVRRPSADDWESIVAILRHYNFQNIGGPEMPRFPLEDCFVAVSGGRVVGVAGYEVLDAVTAKHSLTAVLPELRNRGIGTALKRACFDYLRGRGVKQVFTNCDDPLVIGWNVQRFGFRPTGKRITKLEPYGRPDKDHWVNLVLDLSDPRLYK